MRRWVDNYVDVVFNRATWDDIVMSADRCGISSSEWLASAVKFGLEMDQPYMRKADGSVVERSVKLPLIMVLNG